VDISCLQFLDARQLDPRVVDELVSNFRQTRYESENFIPVLITKSGRSRALRVLYMGKIKVKVLEQMSHTGCQKIGTWFSGCLSATEGIAGNSASGSTISAVCAASPVRCCISATASFPATS
jgi:hypothetical protein